MKTKLSLLLAAVLLAAGHAPAQEYSVREQELLAANETTPGAGTLLTPATNDNTAVPVTATNETTLDEILALVGGGGITNVAVEPYATYAPKSLPGSRDHWGGGVMAVWNVREMVGLGLGLDWLGQLSLVNVNVTLQAPFHPAPARFPSWEAAPFVLAGGEQAYSGSGNFNGSAGVVGDVGA